MNRQSFLLRARSRKHSWRYFSVAFHAICSVANTVARYFAISARGMWAVLVAGRGRWPNKLSRVDADGRPSNWLMTADICFKRQQQQLRDTTATTWSECVAKRKIDEKLLAKNAERSRAGGREGKGEKAEEQRQRREAHNLWHFYAWLILILKTSIYPLDHRTI